MEQYTEQEWREIAATGTDAADAGIPLDDMQEAPVEEVATDE